MDEAASHEWVHDTAAATMTFVAGLAVHDVADVLGIGTASGRVATIGEVDPGSEVLLGVEDQWLVLLELYGFAGIAPGVAAQLSVQGKCASLHCSVNQDMIFAYAEGGAEKRRFDPLLWPDEQWGEPLPEESGLIFGDPDRAYPYEQAVVLLERITGLHMTEEWLFDVPRLVYRAPSGAGA